MQLSKILFQALVQFLSGLSMLRRTDERERLLDMAFHEEPTIFEAISPEAENTRQYAWRLVHYLETQRCGPAETDWALLVYLETLYDDLEKGDATQELASYIAQLRIYEQARSLLRKAGFDPDKVSLEEVIAFYLSELAFDFTTTVKMYVDRFGEQTLSFAPSRHQPKTQGREDISEILGVAVIEDVEHREHDQAEWEPIESVRHRLLAVTRGVLLGEPGSGKSWALRQLALDYAAQWEEQRTSGQTKETFVPVFIELRYFNGAEAQQNGAEAQQRLGRSVLQKARERCVQRQRRLFC